MVVLLWLDWLAMGAGKARVMSARQVTNWEDPMLERIAELEAELTRWKRIANDQGLVRRQTQDENDELEAENERLKAELERLHTAVDPLLRGLAERGLGE